MYYAVHLNTRCLPYACNEYYKNKNSPQLNTVTRTCFSTKVTFNFIFMSQITIEHQVSFRRSLNANVGQFGIAHTWLTTNRTLMTITMYLVYSAWLPWNNPIFSISKHFGARFRGEYQVLVRNVLKSKDISDHFGFVEPECLTSGYYNLTYYKKFSKI